MRGADDGRELGTIGGECSMPFASAPCAAEGQARGGDRLRSSSVTAGIEPSKHTRAPRSSEPPMQLSPVFTATLPISPKRTSTRAHTASHPPQHPPDGLLGRHLHPRRHGRRRRPDCSRRHIQGWWHRALQPVRARRLGDGARVHRRHRPPPRLRPRRRLPRVLASGAAATHGQGVEAAFAHPCGLVLDSDGVLFVADRGNHRIRRITPRAW